MCHETLEQKRVSLHVESHCGHFAGHWCLRLHIVRCLPSVSCLSCSLDCAMEPTILGQQKLCAGQKKGLVNTAVGDRFKGEWQTQWGAFKMANRKNAIAAAGNSASSELTAMVDCVSQWQETTPPLSMKAWLVVEQWLHQAVGMSGLQETNDLDVQCQGWVPQNELRMIRERNSLLINGQTISPTSENLSHFFPRPTSRADLVASSRYN